ncbi:MAG: NHLP family bacteriocin export ABC transporter peptidase/permease/ATPase subunit [Lachnospiraceae bacterium]|nr:NHLP family bacteriocin export ABC transporter peptidase/permease/ATPase subunit [Lachnospiraceae bacterium]
MSGNQSDILRTGHRARVPVIMQLEALECGAAALAMVMAYYNKWVPLEQVRLDCGVSRNGSNAKNMLVAARSYGFDAQGFRCETENLKDGIVLPCILHWNFNHFVVLKGFRGNYALLNDPAKGEIRVTMEELDSSFTGVCLQITPGPGLQPSGKPASILAFTRKRLKGTGSALAFVMLSTLTGCLFGIINPVFARFFTDHLLTGENRELLYPFLGLMALTASAQVVAGWIQSVYSLRINGKMAAAGNSEYMWKILRLPMQFFSQRLAGDILLRQGTNATIAATLVNTLAPLVLHALMMVVYLILMLRWSVILTMTGIAAIILNLLVSQIITAKRINITRVQMRDTGKLAAATVSGIQMIETIKASGSENGWFRKWAGYQASVNAQNVRYARLNRYLGIIPSALSATANALVLILGVLLTMQGRFTLGTILLFQGFLNSFMAPAEEIIAAGQNLQEMRTDMERVEDVMRYPDDPAFSGISLPDEADFSKLSGELELKHVTFGYSRLEEPLIRDFSMHVRPGSSVALVGASGCGKSTISRLISGLYMPWSGEILFDGKPASEIDRSVFTGSVAVVDQEIVLFDDSIADNIKMWDSSVEDFEMILAARDAQIYDDIMARKGGFRHRLAENGRDLSGGQRQRLEIARVLAQDPSIIIMDEATSALDARTEFELVKAVRDRGITCIVIAHRLSTIRDCDEIIVLEHGNVVERGTHEELMAAGDVYTRLIANG